MSKSINDIYQQMQRQRQAALEQNRIIQQNLEAQREAQRQEWLRRRRIDESISTFLANSTSSSAAGGSIQKNITVLTEKTKSGLLFIESVNSGNWQYYSIDFDNIRYDGPIDTIFDRNIYQMWNRYTIESGGYTIIFRNSDNDSYEFLWIDKDGNIIENTHINNNNFEIYSLEGKWIALIDRNENILWYFNGEKLKTDSTILSGKSNWEIGSQKHDTNSIAFNLYTKEVIDEENNIYLTRHYVVDINSIRFILQYQNNIGEEYEEMPFMYCGNDKVLYLGYRRVDNESTTHYTSFKIYDSMGVLNEEISLGEDITTYNIRYSGKNKILLMFWDGENNIGEYKIYLYNSSTGILNQYTESVETYSNYMVNYRDFDPNDFNNNAPNNTITLTFYSDYTSNGNITIPMLAKIYYSFGDNEFSSYIIKNELSDENKGFFIDNISISPNSVIVPYDNGDLTVSFLILKHTSENIITTDKQSDILYIDDYATGEKMLFSLLGNNDFEGSYILFDSFGNIISTLPTIGDNYDTVYNYDTIIVRGNNSEFYTNDYSEEWLEIPYVNNYQNPSPYYNENHTKPGIIIEILESGRIYWFGDAGEANSISDGGDDLFDGGNIIQTNLSIQNSLNIDYTHSRMNNSDGEASINDFAMLTTVTNGDSLFGTGSSYFTNLYPGLFTLVAENIDIDMFSISGNLGSDSNAFWKELSNYTTIHNSNEYTIYVGQEMDTSKSDPSLVQIIIINSDGQGVTHSNNISTDMYDQNITGNIPSNLYYILTSKYKSEETTEEEIKNLVSNYLDNVDNDNIIDINDILSSLNQNYESITDALPPHGSENVLLRLISRENLLLKGIPNYTSIGIGNDSFAIAYENPNNNNNISISLYSITGDLLQTKDTEDNVSYDVITSGERMLFITYIKSFDDNIYANINIHIVGKEKIETFQDKSIWGPSLPIQYIINDYVWWDDY